MIGPEKPIMAVKRKILFRDKYFEGFLPADAFDYLTIIKNNAEFLDRDFLETCKKYKQPIVYFLVRNKANQIFYFQRSVDPEKYREKRLRGKWSIGIGGHIRDKDINNPGAKDHIQGAILRELEEEGGLKVSDVRDIKHVGYINQDEGIGLYHFGLLFSVLVDKELNPLDPSVTNYGFLTVDELRTKLNDEHLALEGWSKIVLDNIEVILG